MAISSQTLKEILESFKAQLDDRLDAFAHGLTNSLTHSLTASLTYWQIQWIECSDGCCH
jgi:hypothetical protein